MYRAENLKPLREFDARWGGMRHCYPQYILLTLCPHKTLREAGFLKNNLGDGRGEATILSVNKNSQKSHHSTVQYV